MSVALTHDQARRLVERTLSSAASGLGVPHAIVDEHTIERPFGWVFFYQSQEYLQTRDEAHQLVGNAPYLVNRHTGELVETGTALPVADYVSQYEKSLGPPGA